MLCLDIQTAPLEGGKPTAEVAAGLKQDGHGEVVYMKGAYLLLISLRCHGFTCPHAS